MTTPTLSHDALNLLASIEEKASTSGSEIRELMDWPHSDAAFRMLVNRLCGSGHVQKQPQVQFVAANVEDHPQRAEEQSAKEVQSTLGDVQDLARIVHIVRISAQRDVGNIPQTRAHYSNW